MSPLAARFEEKVAFSDEGCWLWQGYVDQAGYGRIRLGGRDTPVGYAHRVAHELIVGPIPEGMELDHVCRNRACVRPGHLQPVTHQLNMARSGPAQKTSCKHGHDWNDPRNVYRRRDGRRCCAECARERSRA